MDVLEKNVFTKTEEAWRRCEIFSVSTEDKLLLTTTCIS